MLENQIILRSSAGLIKFQRPEVPRHETLLKFKRTEVPGHETFIKFKRPEMLGLRAHPSARLSIAPVFHVLKRKHHGIHPFTLMKHAHDILNLALPRWARPDSDIRADEFPDGHASIESPKRQNGHLSRSTRMA